MTEITATATTLPATETPVPNLDWSIASIKTMPTRCGEAFTASLRYRGTKVATIEESGRGGAPIVYWNEGKAHTRGAEWNDWVAEYKQINDTDDSMIEPEYDAIVALMDEHEITATLRHASKKGIPLLPPGTTIRKARSYAIASGRSVVNPVDIEALRGGRAEHDRYWDGNGWVVL